MRRNMKIKADNGMIIVLTGGIGSGKSYVLKILQKMGFYTINLDHFTEYCFQDTHIASQIAHNMSDKLGINVKEKILRENGVINRCMLENILFYEFKEFTFADKVSVIEKIIFPLVQSVQQELVNSVIHRGRSMVIESPLFIESKTTLKYNALIAVTTTEEIQRRRILLRKYMTNTKFLAIVGRQLSDDQKLARANFSLCNIGNRHAVIYSIRRVVKKNGSTKRGGARYGNKWA